ncbi:EAL domain-containing protein [Luteimonas yindakuii]|nr:EAL domain-containing protein [Luteimonas yindakuii]
MEQGTSGTRADTGLPMVADRAGMGAADRRHRRALRVGATILTCVAVVAAAVGWNDYRVRRAAGERYVLALADGHAREIGLAFDSLARGMRSVSSSVAFLESGGFADEEAITREALAALLDRHPHARSVQVVERAGLPAFVDPAVPAMRLQLGPLVREDGRDWELGIAMRIHPAPGSDAPRWLAGRLGLQFFDGILADHEVGEHGVATILTRDALLVARSDTGTRHTGLNAAQSPVFSRLKVAPRSVVDARSRLDGRDRVVAFTAVEGLPLVATVGMTPRALYGGWWTFVAVLAAGFISLLLAWLAGLRFLQVAARRERRMRRSIEASEEAVGHLRERVRDVEAQYRFLYDQHPLPACVFDRETLAILEANEAAVHEYGYSRDEFLALNAAELLAEGRLEDVREEVQAYPRAYGHRIWLHRRRDGSHFHALIFASDLLSFRDRPARLVIAMDVSDRVRAEADLRLLRRAVAASEEGLFVLDVAPDRLVYANAAFNRLTGTGVTGEGLEIDPSTTEVVDARATAALREAIGRGEEAAAEVHDQRDPDDPRWLEVRMGPVPDAAGVVTHYVGLVADITARRRDAEERAFRASHDALTGLANRDCLIEAIDRAVTEHDGVVATCFLDLDRFQLVNDSLGHGVGDELLVASARRLEAAAGAGSMVARLGGDEFGVLLRCPDEAALSAQVEALRAAVAEACTVRGVALHVTPSIGYARHPVDGEDGQALLRAASQAGAQAKRLGRNRSVAYRAAFDPRAGERLELIQDLHRALQQDEFELAFQLQFDHRRQPRGMEALVRWRHPERGLLGPGAFMEACEESGLVLRLGRWVLGEAARRWCQLDERGWGGLRMGVNVSALQFQEGLVADVGGAVRRCGLPPGRLELELTESVLLASPVEARTVMQELSTQGVSLAIDDFGTGYSSLAYLKELPLQRLKLDQSFVRDLGRDPGNEAISEAILGMARSLGLAVTAEGVETEAQFSWLHARGCGEFQGYLLARPEPFDAVLARLGAPG